MNNTLFKKETLIEYINYGIVPTYSILGVPTKELLEYYLNNKDIIELLRNYGIESSIRVYLSENSSYICSIVVTPRSTDKTTLNAELDLITSKLLRETLDVYQAEIIPSMLNKIIGIGEEKLSFTDMLSLIPIPQKELAEKIGKSKQVISDMKNGRTIVSASTISRLVNSYPLLPWTQYLQSITD